jgi:hypothetical protein
VGQLLLQFFLLNRDYILVMKIMLALSITFTLNTLINFRFKRKTEQLSCPLQIDVTIYN